MFIVNAEDHWLGVQDRADALDISRDTIDVWLTKGPALGHWVGELWKFERDEIDLWLKAGYAAGAVGSRQADDNQPRSKKRDTHSDKGQR